MQDTAEEVRALRQQGVRVAAVFMGENVSASDARTIYGQDLVRIQRMDQLAAAAGKLIQEEIRGVIRVSMCKYIVKLSFLPAADIKGASAETPPVTGPTSICNLIAINYSIFV